MDRKLGSNFIRKEKTMREFEVAKNTAFAAVYRDGFEIGRNAGLDEGRQRE